jgi:hypothetical protein
MIDMEIDQHIAALESDGCLLADAAGCAGLAAPVPSCPGWRVADLLRHIRYIHQWAAAHVCETPTQVIAGPLEAELLAGGPPDAELLDAYRTGHRALTEAWVPPIPLWPAPRSCLRPPHWRSGPAARPMRPPSTVPTPNWPPAAW